MEKEKEALTYESAYAELQQILAGLQGEEISIDELAATLARAQELIRFCRERLRQAEEESGKLQF